jgi:hypothetical protein
MSHCHCSRCRKAHGTAYATYVARRRDTFRLSGEEHVEKWESMPGFDRCFCRRCGSVVPGTPCGKLIFLPVGCFEDDPGARPEMHIFVGSKAPWFEISDGLPRYDTNPPGVDGPVLEDRRPLDPPGKPRGSCLCGGVTFVVEGEPIRCVYCHCSRCRRARSAAFAANFVSRASGVRFNRGVELLGEYKVPDAKHFTQTFCRVCGSSMPRIDPNRDLAVVPMGSLDDDPGTRPTAHIFADSIAPWDSIGDSLPRYTGYPPQSPA